MENKLLPPFLNQALSAVFTKAAQFLNPPEWLTQEGQRRIVLLLNHVLKQEPRAMERIKRQSGKSIQFEWQMANMPQPFTLQIICTPAGLCEPLFDDEGKAPDLKLAITEDSPANIAKNLAAGQKPSVRIEGDVQLAAEINWLAEHVRWDIEEDLSRVVGDGAAHFLVSSAGAISDGLKGFAGNFPRPKFN